MIVSPTKEAKIAFMEAPSTGPREFSQKEISDFISVAFAGGAERIFLRWDPMQTDVAGRVTQVKLRGRRERDLTGIQFLEAAQEFFGENSLRSMRFTLEPMRRTTIYRGMGSGNGVGMCQDGVDGLAKKGFTFQQILEFYYTGIDITAAKAWPGRLSHVSTPPAAPPSGG
jgi:SpoIID/LytB domain protein